MTKKRVLLLLANGFEAFEGAVFTDVFGWADTYGDEPVELISAARHPQLKCTPYGFTILPDMQLHEMGVDMFDALAIPGGFEIAGFYDDAYAEEFLKIIRQFMAQDKPIASICVAALPLAKSGILTGRCATTYHLMGGRRRKQLAEMGVKVVDDPIVRDGNVITSTSPATAMEVALALLAMVTTTQNAENIRKLMGF